MTNSDHDQGGGRQLLIGLDAIARVAGVSAQVARRLIESGDLPVHKIGIGSGTICATPTAIRRWRAARRARVSGWRQPFAGPRDRRQAKASGIMSFANTVDKFQRAEPAQYPSEREVAGSQ
jgi:hypothetical protein